MSPADVSRLGDYLVAVNYAVYTSLLLRLGVGKLDPHVIAFRFV